MEWLVGSENSGIKLIDFLHQQMPTLSLRHIKRSIEQNSCQINGRTERFASTVVGRGDRIAFAESQPEQSAKAAVLFEDPYFLFCDKPPGIASEQLYSDSTLVLVHRLDKETSGVLLFAKSKEMFEAMVQLFKEKKVQKEYVALVDGVPSKTQGTIENQLGKIATYQGQALWGAVEKGLPARTEWVVEKAKEQAALLRCFPITGRTHQIRVHLSGIGHPILGDYQYGRRFRSPFRPRRCMLHAEALSFSHPVTGQDLIVKSPLPADFVLLMQAAL